jgi:hypothetical protein
MRMPAVAMDQTTDIVSLERRCRDDFGWTCGNLLWIRPKEEALTRLRLNWPQRHVYERYLKPAWDNREALALTVLKTRRVGMTTLFMAWLYHKIRWYRGQNCYVIANDDPTLAEIFLMAGRFHENLPPDFLPPIDKKNTEQLSYAPPWDSSLRARIAKYGEVARGTTLHHVLLDELAFYPDPSKILLGVLEAVPRASASSLILSSTANGAETWFEAVWNEFSRSRGEEGWGGRRWQTVFLPWFVNPYNRIPGMPTMTLDPEERELQQAHTLSNEQLAWRRVTITEYERLFPGFGKRKFAQENPATAEEAFLLAGDCIFPEEALDRLRLQERPPERGFTVHTIGTWTCALVAHKEVENAPFQVWEPPIRGHRYAIGVDVSRGVGRDDSAVVIVRMPGFVQVAHWYDNYVGPKQLAYVIAAIARYYAAGSGDIPICTVEVNDAGVLTNAELETLRGVEPLDIYVWEYFDKIGTSQQSTKTGWLTTQVTKNILVGIANSLLHAHMITVPSTLLRHDMSRTVEIKPGLYRTGGCDLCIAWLLALVTAYRKIARWEWDVTEGRRPHPVQVFPDAEGRPDDPVDSIYTEHNDRTKHDVGWAKLMRQRRDGGSLVSLPEDL